MSVWLFVNNMGKKIIYPTESGKVAILTPILECELTLEDIAKKDVPDGVPYKIIEESDIPVDRTFRDAWEYQP